MDEARRSSLSSLLAEACCLEFTDVERSPCLLTSLVFDLFIIRLDVVSKHLTCLGTD